jgi:predicted metal-dependent hydrolase
MHKIDKLIRSKRRTLSLEINESAEVIVRAPLKMPKEIIERFIYEKRIWIDKKLYIIQAKQKNETKFERGESFLYLGANYKLDITDEVFIFFNSEKFNLSIRDKKNAEKIFKKWYKERAKIVIAERVDYFSKYMLLEYKNIKITSAEKRWGSCSGNNNLNFTWRLIMAPMNIIDYVVVHELAHILQKNHSKKFWAIVETYIPDYKLKRKWLRENGYRLKL